MVAVVYCSFSCGPLVKTQSRVRAHEVVNLLKDLSEQVESEGKAEVPSPHKLRERIRVCSCVLLAGYEKNISKHI